MCHKMDGGSAEKSAQMWSVSPLIVIMTHNRDAGREQSASVIIICNHVTLQCRTLTLSLAPLSAVQT